MTDVKDKSWPEYQDFLLEAIQGGVTSVQLRIKDRSMEEIYQWARVCKDLLTPLNIPLIINDYMDIALAVDAQGVHLGQSDYSPIEARKRLGPHKIIGWSVENLDQLAAANQLNCLDYIGVGAVFPTQSKRDCKAALGLKGLQQIVSLSKYPVVAIGGIILDNVGSVWATGVEGVAVIAALHESLNPKQTAMDFNRR